MPLPPGSLLCLPLSVNLVILLRTWRTLSLNVITALSTVHFCCPLTCLSLQKAGDTHRNWHTVVHICWISNATFVKFDMSNGKFVKCHPTTSTWKKARIRSHHWLTGGLCSVYYLTWMLWGHKSLSGLARTDRWGPNMPGPGKANMPVHSPPRSMQTLLMDYSTASHWSQTQHKFPDSLYQLIQNSTWLFAR